MHMNRVLVAALVMAWLLIPGVRPVSAYDGEARPSLSCTDKTATMTRTVVVTVIWTGVYADRLDAQAWETNPPGQVLGSETTTFPVAKKGTVSLTFSFSDTAPFGNVQWQLYPPSQIAPVQAGQLDASNFPGCPHP
jgi:hypothetical protein